MLESLGAFLDGEMGNSTGAIAISDIDVQAVGKFSVYQYIGT